MEKRLILASSSPARRRLMDSLRIRYEAIAPPVDESIPADLSTFEAARALARRKSEAITRRFPNALVLGADQLVDRDGETLGKPRSRDEARAQLASLLGRTHQIVTGLCLLGPGISEALVEVTRVTFYSLGTEELERYLDLGEWEGCAGGYRIEAAGQALLAGLEGDRTNVEGLPMLQVVRLLRRADFPFFGEAGPGA